MSYTPELHQHRLAAWAASTSARASNLCRFKVKLGIEMLEGCGFDENFLLASLPAISSIDAAHAQWRRAVITAAKKEGIRNVTHGVAAKLINCYLKVRFICGSHYADPKVRALHPPVDRLLLKGLAEHNVGGYAKKWREANQWAWSKFTSEQYQDVIDRIRTVVGNEMWTIEEHWRGHQ